MSRHSDTDQSSWCRVRVVQVYLVLLLHKGHQVLCKEVKELVAAACVHLTGDGHLAHHCLLLHTGNTRQQPANTHLSCWVTMLTSSLATQHTSQGLLCATAQTTHNNCRQKSVMVCCGAVLLLLQWPWLSVLPLRTTTPCLSDSL